jgi:plasmid stabilization system protein ParE
VPSLVIAFAESALRDLEDILVWHAEQGAPHVGERSVRQVFRRVEALAEHPDLGSAVPEFDQAILRELIDPPYRIVCRRQPERISIVRVWRSERLQRLAGDDAQSP